jgi:N-methylhydantoinase A
MFGALRLVSVQKGMDPRDFALVAFGGAGPLHGNAMAILAGCFPVIVPPTPGVLSALGFLYSDIKNEFARTFARTLDDVDVGQIVNILNELGNEADGWLGEEGLGQEGRNIRYQADVRYFRQGYEFTLDVDPAELNNRGLSLIIDQFGADHERQYGFKLDQPVEVVNLRAIGTGTVDKVRFPGFESSGPDASSALIRQDQVYFGGGFVNAGVYDRDSLRAGNHIPGPAIVVQKDSTCVIHPGYAGEVDEYLNILIHPEGQALVRRTRA